MRGFDTMMKSAGLGSPPGAEANCGPSRPCALWGAERSVRERSLPEDLSDARNVGNNRAMADGAKCAGERVRGRRRLALSVLALACVAASPLSTLAWPSRPGKATG